MKDQSPILRLRADALTWRRIEDEVIVLDRRSWAYLSVNDAGGALWDRIVAGATEDDLVAALAGAYGLERATARGDVLTFVGMLREHDLLER